jgi:acyl carrier protein
MEDEIINSLTNYIATEIIKQPRRIIAPDEPIITSGLVDSFSLIDLALYIEKTFSVHIDDTELNADTFDTISQLAQLIIDRK